MEPFYGRFRAPPRSPSGRVPFRARAEVAQLVEHGSEKPGVVSSILTLGTRRGKELSGRSATATPRHHSVCTQLSRGRPACTRRAPTVRTRLALRFLRSPPQPTRSTSGREGACGTEHM